jgi:hypothetical protein
MLWMAPGTCIIVPHPMQSKFHLFWVTNDRAFFLYKAVPCVLSSQQIFQARAYPEIMPFYQQTCHSSRLSLSLQSLMCQTLCRLVHVLTGTFLINKACGHSLPDYLIASWIHVLPEHVVTSSSLSSARSAPSREQARPSKTPYGSKMVSHIPEDINPQPS